MPKIIIDEFSTIKSKHYRWQLRQAKKGFCLKCGKVKVDALGQNCEGCKKYFRDRYAWLKVKKTKISKLGQKASRIVLV